MRPQLAQQSPESSRLVRESSLRPLNDAFLLGDPFVDREVAAAVVEFAAIEIPPTFVAQELARVEAVHAAQSAASVGNKTTQPHRGDLR